MGDDKESVSGNLYSLVKSFLKDFFAESKKGYGRHQKGVWIFIGFAFLCFAVAVIAAYKVSETPWFCGTCHNMTVYVDSWKASTHKNVPCLSCHYKPGFWNHLVGKWQDGQVSLVYFVTGKVITRPHAEIDDLSCLQSGCHKREDLNKDIVFKNVIFNHVQHLDKLKREMQLRCTTCHSQIVQGTHITVTEENCFICHFQKGKGQKDYFTGCTSCHFEARGDIKVDSFNFNHKKFVKRGVKCETCHTNVVTGDGHVQENACLQCHNKREILEAKYTQEFLHKNHVTDHKVECFLCHTSIKHGIVKAHSVKGDLGECANCHKTGIHEANLSMYLGKGAKLTKGMPDRKALLNLDCSVCHKPGTSHTSAQDQCKECHGTFTDGMVERWKKLVKTKENELQKDMQTVQGATKQDGKITTPSTKVIDQVLQNQEFIKKGNIAHNILYGLNIISANRNALADAKTKGTGPTSLSAPYKMTCTEPCHGNVNEKKVPFGAVFFTHDMHAEGEKSCLKCHGTYENHGQTTYKGCSECHHGEGMGKVSCKDCHKAEDSMLRAKGSQHTKIACIDCHSAIKQAKKPGEKETIANIKENCVRCHNKGYASQADEWIKKNKEITAQCKATKAATVKEIEEIEAKDGKHSVPLRKVFDETCDTINLLVNGKYAHNPSHGDAILAKSQSNLVILKKMMKDKREGKPIILK
jgi:hypothetical protein